MAIIAPFRGITYNLDNPQDFSKLVAPPYDVISEEEQDLYYSEHPHNVIRLILGKRQKGDSDWDNCYTRAADYFRRWESEGVLIRSPRPVMYICSTTYTHKSIGQELTRWGFIALVRIEDEDSGVILPHEKTFSAHKDDRLRLMRACNAQFSQIFGLYEDPENSVLSMCQKIVSQPPPISFQFRDGTKHRMWIIENHQIFKEIARLMSNRPILIADGHHRYETARNFRNIMRTRYGRKPENRSYEFVMMYLSSMNDKGLTILPSHRLIKKVPDFHLKPFLEKARAWFDIQEFSHSGKPLAKTASLIKQELKNSDPNTTRIGFYLHGQDKYWILTLKQDMRNKMGEDLHPSLKKLDVLVLSRLVLQKTLGFTREQLDDEETFQYQSSMEQSLTLVNSGKFLMTFLLNPTKIEQVIEVARNMLVMPRKSTYFYPKVITGLVFNKINPHETIETY